MLLLISILCEGLPLGEPHDIGMSPGSRDPRCRIFGLKVFSFVVANAEFRSCLWPVKAFWVSEASSLEFPKFIP